LYRPGFETIELKPWAPRGEVRWKAAGTLADQCKAVDDLVAGDLEPGGISTDHQRALKFAANEYRRLANLHSLRETQDSPLCRQVSGKADELEKRASESFRRGWVERLID
jgi:hypothetical protein